MKHALWAVILIWAWSLPVWPATRTVSDVQSLQSALNDTRAGDTIVLQSGTYTVRDLSNRDLVFPDIASGNSGARSRLTVAGGATAIIDVQCPSPGSLTNETRVVIGNNNGLQWFTIEGGAGTLIFDGGTCGRWVFSGQGDNLIFQDFENRWFVNGFEGGWNNTVFRNLHVHHFGVRTDGAQTRECWCGVANCPPNDPTCPETCDDWFSGKPPSGHCHGFYQQGQSHDNLFENNHIHHGEGWGFHLYSENIADSNDVVRNNIIHDNFGHGIGNANHRGLTAYNNLSFNNGTGAQLGGHPVTPNELYNNTFVNNRTAGIRHIDGSITLINNISIDNPDSNIEQGSGSFSSSSNLCGGSGGTSGCQLSGTAGDVFREPGGGDYHLKASIPGANLIGFFNTDMEGNQRSAFDVGALEFIASEPEPQPEPGEIVLHMSFESGSGTTEPDDTGFGHTGTWSSCVGNNCRTTGIIGATAGSFTAGRYVEITNTAGLKPLAAFTISARYRAIGIPIEDCDVASMGDAYLARVAPNGQLLGLFSYTSGPPHWRVVESSNGVLNNGMAHHLVVSYDGAFLRVWVDNANVGTLPTAGLVNYTGLGSSFLIGKHGNGGTDFDCSAVIDQLYVLDGFCDSACVQNFYNQQVSSSGLGFVRYRFMAPDAKEGTTIAGIGANTNMAINRSAKTRLVVDLERVGSTLNEFFPLHARVNGGAKTRLTNSCATFPVCIATDTVFGMGDPTSAVYLAWDASVGATGYDILYGPSTGNYTASIDVGNVTEYPLTGLTPGATQFFAVRAYDAGSDSSLSNEVSAVVPNLLPGPFTQVPGRFVVDTINEAFTTTIADGQRAVQAYTIAFGSSLNHGDVVQFEPSYSSNSALDSLPPVLPAVTIQVTSQGHATFGGVFRGAMVR